MELLKQTSENSQNIDTLTLPVITFGDMAIVLMLFIAIICLLAIVSNTNAIAKSLNQTDKSKSKDLDTR